METKSRFVDPTNKPEVKVSVLTEQQFSKLLDSQNRRWRKGSHRRRMHTVGPQLRVNECSTGVYDPKMVSLGPYHHGEPKLTQAEEFKYLILDWYTKGNEDKQRSLYNMILKMIDEIRDCYAEVSIVEKYDDQALALMMLLDGFFILNYMENITTNKNSRRKSLGVVGAIPFTIHDIVVLENQIPFDVLKLLINALYEKVVGEEIMRRFMSWMLLVEVKQAKIPREEEDPPLHLLEACLRVISEKENDPPRSFILSTTCHTRRSVTLLKAKGIHFSPSSSQSLNDISFNSHTLYGRLHIPVHHVSDQTQVILSNMIAYEICIDSKTDLAVLSFTNFMKSLIESPNDVKELQKRGILFNKFDHHEQVVEVFKSIDTFGLLNSDIYQDVTHRVAQHCSSSSSYFYTTIGDLIDSRLKSPWTVIALLTATLLVVLTFVQTWYTIHPAN